jgi:hypothetical protein
MEQDKNTRSDTLEVRQLKKVDAPSTRFKQVSPITANADSSAFTDAIGLT